MELIHAPGEQQGLLAAWSTPGWAGAGGERTWLGSWEALPSATSPRGQNSAAGQQGGSRGPAASPLPPSSLPLPLPRPQTRATASTQSPLPALHTVPQAAEPLPRAPGWDFLYLNGGFRVPLCSSPPAERAPPCAPQPCACLCSTQCLLLGDSPCGVQAVPQPDGEPLEAGSGTLLPWAAPLWQKERPSRAVKVVAEGTAQSSHGRCCCHQCLGSCPGH